MKMINSYSLLTTFDVSNHIFVQNTLIINALVTNYTDLSMALNTVKVLGLNRTVTNVNVNGKAYSNFVYNIPDDVCISYCSFN